MAAEEQDNGGREGSKEEINKRGEKDEMTTASAAAFSEVDADVFSSFDLPATEKQGISKTLTILSFFPLSFFPSSIHVTRHQSVS